MCIFHTPNISALVDLMSGELLFCYKWSSRFTTALNHTPNVLATCTYIWPQPLLNFLSLPVQILPVQRFSLSPPPPPPHCYGLRSIPRDLQTQSWPTRRYGPDSIPGENQRYTYIVQCVVAWPHSKIQSLNPIPRILNKPKIQRSNIIFLVYIHLQWTPAELHVHVPIFHHILTYM